MKNLISKLKGKKRKLFVSLLLLWFLKVNPVKATSIQGVDGFTPTYVCPKRQTYSREVTALSTRLKKKPNNQNIPRENRSRYDRPMPEFGSNLQVRRKFKHAPNFGVIGNPNRENFELFKDKIAEHMRDTLNKN